MRFFPLPQGKGPLLTCVCFMHEEDIYPVSFGTPLLLFCTLDCVCFFFFFFYKRIIITECISISSFSLVHMFVCVLDFFSCFFWFTYYGGTLLWCDWCVYVTHHLALYMRFCTVYRIFYIAVVCTLCLELHMLLYYHICMMYLHNQFVVF